MSTVSILRTSVTGVVLAGGRGLRFGGADKGLVEHNGRPLAAHQLDRLRGEVDALLINANRNHAQYRDFGVPVIGDLHADWRGPLAGMLAALDAATTPWIACLPCDTLNLPADTVARLVGAAEAAGAEAAYALGENGPQYALCALHRALLPALQRAVDDGRLVVREFLFSQRAVAADFRDCRLANVNRPDALVRA